jgi:tripartite-type tricarboxylate transporter receptor subunit TctC
VRGSGTGSGVGEPPQHVLEGADRHRPEASSISHAAAGARVQQGTSGGADTAPRAAGKMRVLAVTSATRLIAAPELPTAAELGFPGMAVTGSIGLLAPAGTPIAIIKQIAEATHTAVADPAYKQMLIDAGIEPTFDSNPENFRQSLASDVALWAPVVKALGLKID